MSYDARAVANEFLDLARGDDEPLTPLKLQKLVYFAQGWHLAIKDAPLLDEQVEAQRYGPVVPSLFRAFREFGNRPIDALAGYLAYFPDPSPDDPSGEDFEYVEPRLDDDSERGEFARTLVKRVWDIYKKFSPAQLSTMAHMPGTPWHQVHEKYRGSIPKGTDVPAELMREHFLEQARAKAVAV